MERQNTVHRHASWYPEGLSIPNNPVIKEKGCVDGDYTWQQLTIENWAEAEAACM